ncbi:MAG: restriction endonuclease [Planctomycetes bacterium]|nr:restriction endonuclease [Planctomycetota bacterium]MBI4222673.1 restriction endonuclease [Planctomycetota bacterium]
MNDKANKLRSLYHNPGYILERQVTTIYRALGAEVKHDVALAGNQIDIIVRERTPSGTFVTTAIECKAYSKPVGVEIINSFGTLVYLLKQRNLIDRAILVAPSGFTRHAREAAQIHDIELLELADLVQLCLFCTFFVCVGSLDHLFSLCRKFRDEFIQFGNYYRACHLCKKSKKGIVEFQVDGCFYFLIVSLFIFVRCVTNL